MLRVAVIPGDGIGVEVTREACRVLERVAALHGKSLRLVSFDFGAERYLRDGVTLPQDALARKSAQAVHRLAHRVERIGHRHDDGVGRVLHDLGRHRLHDAEVDVQQIVAAHPGLARRSRGHHAAVGALDNLHVCRAADVHVDAQHRGGLEHVERLALRQAVDDVEERDIAQPAQKTQVGTGGADIASANDGDLGEHGAGETNRPGWTGKHPSIDVGRC